MRMFYTGCCHFVLFMIAGRCETVPRLGIDVVAIFKRSTMDVWWLCLIVAAIAYVHLND
jgi:hypothetical protein